MALGDLKLAQGTAGLAEEAGVGDGHGNLIGEGGEQGNIILREGFGLLRLNVEGADDLIGGFEGQGNLRTGVGEIGVIKENGIFTNIESNARLTLGGNIADEANLANFKLVAAFQHALAAFRVSSLENGVFFILVKEEDANMVEAEALADGVGDERKEGIEILLGDNGMGNFSDGLKAGGAVTHLLRALSKLGGAVGNALLKASEGLAELVDHAVEGNGEGADLVSAFNGGLDVEVASGGAFGDNGEVGDGVGEQAGQEGREEDGEAGDASGEQDGGASLGYDGLEGDALRLHEDDHPGAGGDPGDGGGVQFGSRSAGFGGIEEGFARFKAGGEVGVIGDDKVLGDAPLLLHLGHQLWLKRGNE